MNKKINTAMASLGLVALLALGIAAPAFAQTSVGLGISVAATTSVGSVGISATIITKAQTKADAEITRRITALNDLSTRVNAMEKLSADEKSSLSTTIQAQVTNMTNLQAAIAADVSSDATSSLKADIKSITGSYRIFALIIPQGYIEAASDRGETIVDTMNDLGAKFQARISAAQSAGDNVTAVQATFADFNAKVSDANTQAQAAVTEIASLTPDNGVQAEMQANTSALKDARSKIKVATQDFTTARADAQTIAKDLVSFEASASASSTVSATTTNSQ